MLLFNLLPSYGIKDHISWHTNHVSGPGSQPHYKNGPHPAKLSQQANNTCTPACWHQHASTCIPWLASWSASSLLIRIEVMVTITVTMCSFTCDITTKPALLGSAVTLYTFSPSKFYGERERERSVNLHDGRGKYTHSQFTGQEIDSFMKEIFCRLPWGKEK